jgi:hypothetical protein
MPDPLLKLIDVGTTVPPDDEKPVPPEHADNTANPQAVSTETARRRIKNSRWTRENARQTFKSSTADTLAP